MFFMKIVYSYIKLYINSKNNALRQYDGSLTKKKNMVNNEYYINNLIVQFVVEALIHV